jgi:hypothetical protein
MLRTRHVQSNVPFTSHLRRRASWVVAGLVPMFLMAFLAGIFWLRHFICQHLFDECKGWSPDIYFREIAFFHFCTDLLVYISRSQEFRSAARCVLFGTPKPKPCVYSRGDIV